MADENTPPDAENGHTPPSASEQDLKPYSCILCKQRKIKCDKHHPCQNCVKAKSQCIFRAPAPPRRGKRKPAEVNLLARLKRYEDMLQGLGVAIEKLHIDEAGDRDVKSPSEPQQQHPTKMDNELLSQRGRLIAGEANSKSLYVEDNLWARLTEELKDDKDVLGDSSSEDEDNLPIDRNAYEINSTANRLIFNLGNYTPSLQIPHPPIERVRRLWEVFKQNFDPLVKIVHVPTVQNQIFTALQDPGSMSKVTEALLFAIYCGAVVSLDNSETQAYFDEPQPQMLARYRIACQQALLRAGLLKSNDFVLVQANTIFLLSVRLSIDPRSLWMLTGTNFRLALRIGLHRDGTHLGLSPFETEIRRRLWWQVLILDAHSAILSGQGGVGNMMFNQCWDTKQPLNINDADIWPEMEAAPLERQGPTEMFFVLLRHEFGRFFRQYHHAQSYYRGITQMAADEKLKKISEVEHNIEQRFLRFCDPLNSLHHLAQGAGRSAVSSMRLMFLQPYKTESGKKKELTEEEDKQVFLHALKIVEYDSLSYSNPLLRGYRWHVRAYFQYFSFTVMLSQLCHRGDGEDVTRAWSQVSEVFKNHPELKAQRTLQVALNKLVCKAWGTRAAALIQAGEQPVPPPGVAEILTIRAQADRQHGQSARTNSSSMSASSGRSPGSVERTMSDQSWGVSENSTTNIKMNMSGYDMGSTWGANWPEAIPSNDDLNIDFNSLQQQPTPMDWATWEEIFQSDNVNLGGGTTLMGGGTVGPKEGLGSNMDPYTRTQ